MDSLPTELLLAIVDLVVLDQSCLAACNRLSKRWQRLTRHLLYREPKLNRLSTFEAFLKTVDTPAAAHYLQRINNGRRYRMNNVGGASTTTSVSGTTMTSANHSQTASSATSSPQSSSISTSSHPSGSQPILDLYTPVGALVETIDLSMLPHRWDEIHIGHIQSLVAGCPFVSTLNLSTCLQLRDNAVQIIVEELGPRQLKSLVLSGCTRISDLAVLSICAHAARLENLELSACDRISDISVLELGSATVAWASDQSDSGTSRAGDHRIPGQDVDRESKPPQGVSRSIRSLDLSHCTRITDTGIRGLRMGATQLTSLNLEGCFGVVSGYDGLDLGDWEDLEDTDSEEDMGSDPGTASDQEEEH